MKKHPITNNMTEKHFLSALGDNAWATFAPNFAVKKLIELMPIKA